jgi:hypothetical protein
MPLSAPFAWAGGAFPGGVGSVTVGGTSYPYCTGTLAVGAQCLLKAQFSPVDGGTYQATVDLAYSDAMGPVTPDASGAIQGESSTLPP